MEPKPEHKRGSQKRKKVRKKAGKKQIKSR
jgi:hypothetical protein